ncbi:DNA ligase D [Rhodoligotrophos ferricapiens]|uniref:DNA ligase D n=1 Tax=Rhodoligotrophos ferricapiens TaxID=3069264 RepID=UPI00315D3EDA
MALETYRRKRDFTATPEPKGRKGKTGGHNFVIQKHAARRLHYDLRLELDGVLKSWAVTRGPSLVPGEKRLAVEVEDHPLDYGGFEGTIPKGEYGGGTVLVWDRGTWEPLFDAHHGLKKGHLEFELHGEKLSGRWHLVRMARRAGERRDNWLLIKGEDEAAREPDDPDILEEQPQSVITGRSIDEISKEAPGWSSKTGRIRKTPADGVATSTKSKTTTEKPVKKARAAKGGKASTKTAEVTEAKGKEAATIRPVKKAKKAAMPGFIEPSLATLSPRPPEGDRWIHEVKFDGYRLQARIDADDVKLLTRRGLDWTDRFGKEIADAFRALPVGQAIIDGELVVEGDAGASDFSTLQADLSEGRTDRFVYYAFDLLYLDGQDLRASPLVERKAALEQLLEGAPERLRYSEHFEVSGEMVLRHACRLSLEGVVSKLRSASYSSGRNRSWIKSKCSARQEFVVGGYVPSTTSRQAIGSLALGVYENGKLQHVGRVGTGFTAKLAAELFDRLQPLRAERTPFSGKLSAEERRGLVHVRPELVAEIEFRGWTGDAHLRHASFRGLREDKPAEEITRETTDTSAPELPRRTVSLTHPDRLYWPDAGVTKEGLADYYAQVWTFIAPFLVGRPLALLRCPGGISEACFFQKHAWKGLNRNIVLFKDPKDKDEEPMLSIDSFDGLMGLVQGGVLEIHPWGSTIADLERPDMIILDLDPGENVGWSEVIEAAQEVRQRLIDAGLVPFLKTTGGKGLHVTAPLTPNTDWETTKAFTKELAEAMVSDSPGRYVATITKSKRRGKILVDYLRNGRGSTAVAPYSTRARPGAPVSMPLDWSELTPAIGPAHFTVTNTPARLSALTTDPWADFRKAAVPLEKKKTKRAR